MSADVNGELLSPVAAIFLHRFIKKDYQLHWYTPTDHLVILQYISQKGFCEDLDEGKYSLPLIYVLQTSPRNALQENMLLMRGVCGKLMYEQIIFVLEQIKVTSSLDWTKSVLDDLHSLIGAEIEMLDKVFDKNNAESKLW